MKIEVSNGEIIDKLTILIIKINEIRDLKKLENIKKEYNILKEHSQKITNSYEIEDLKTELLRVNSKLWEIEDKLRHLEKAKNFNEEFIELARSVYYTNDKRSEIKKKINIITNSGVIEEKSYQKYN